MRVADKPVALVKVDLVIGFNYWLDDRTPKQASPRYPPMSVASKAARIAALPATIPRDKYVLLATVASSIS